MVHLRFLDAGKSFRLAMYGMEGIGQRENDGISGSV